MHTSWKASLPYREVYYRDAKACNNLKEIAQQEQCVCRACELAKIIKRSMKKNDNGEVYKLRKTFAVFHLVPMFIGRGTSACLAAECVVGGHYTNATKQTQTVELFRLIIVLVSLRVATSYLDSNFLFLYIV